MRLNITSEKTPRLLRLHQVVDLISSLVNILGMVALLGLMLIITTDVSLRYFFNSPISGAMDLIVVMLSILVFAGMAYTASKKGHVSVDFLARRLSERTRVVVDSITGLLVAGILCLIVWQTLMHAQRMFIGRQASAALDIPFWPFVLVVAFGSALFLIVILVDLLSNIKQALEGNHIWSWIGLIAGSLLILFFCISVATQLLPWQLSRVTAGLIGLALLLPVLLSGMPVAFVLMLLGFLGLSFIVNLGSGMSPLGITPFHVSVSYSFVVIPLFILMGEFVFVSGLSQSLYSAAYKWLGHSPGGLASATVGACAGFASICGSTVATAVTMGTVALPEMKRYKYLPSLATGCVAAGGTIGTLIPPSVTFIIYGILTEQSIGRLFIAGICPGLLMASLFIISIYVRSRLSPNLGPVGPKTSLIEKMVSLKGVWGILLLFLLVIGGIYMGIFSPSEAAGIGAFGALVISLARRGITRRGFTEALLDTGKITSMTFLLFIGATIFSSFLAVSRVPLVVADYVSGLPLPPLLILGVILFVYFALGCVIPSWPVLIMITPIFFPAVIALGFDPIWFGVLLVIMCEMGALTPPVGINVYVVAGVAPDTPMSTIFRGVLPFLLMQIICVGLLIAFPQIALFLPNLMKG